MKTYYKHDSQNTQFQLLRTFLFPLRLLFALISKLLALFSYLLPHRWRRRLNTTQRLFLNVVLTAILLVFGVWIYTSFINPEQTKAAWFDQRWLYRQIATISNSNGSDLTNYQQKITLDTASLITAGKMRSDCNDLRITNGKGILLSYWIETGQNACNTATTTIWTKVPIISSSNTDLYLYYGNLQAPSVQNGDQVFELFDDFSGDSLNSQKWSSGTVAAATGTDFSVTGGNLVGGNNNRFIRSLTTFTGDYTAESRSYTTTANTNGYTTIGFFAATTNNFGILDHNGTSYYRNDSSWVNFSLNGNTQWTRNTVKVAGTTATYTRTGETSGTSTASATNSGISGEYIRIGARYDNGNYNQNFSSSWDWIFVRKVVATEPTISFSAEEQSPGPIAYWGMDEGSGSIVHDGTAMGNNGTISNATWAPSSECKVGRCLYFNGTNASVNFGNISPTASMAGDLTISFWIKPTNIAKGRQNPMGKAYGGEFDFTLETSGSLSYYHGAAGNDAAPYTQFNPTTNLSQNQWSHVVLTRDTTTRTLKYYINGKLDKTTTYASNLYPTLSPRSFRFGYEYAGYFQGYLDDVVIYNTTKSASDVKSLYSAGDAGGTAVKGIATSIGSSDNSGLNDGLVGYWKMDETAADSCTGGVNDSCDSSGTGTDVAWTGDVAASNSGKFGYGTQFDGNGDYISLGNIVSSTSKTYALWVKPTAVQGTNRQGLIGENTGSRIDYGNGAGSSSFHALVTLSSGSPAYKELTASGNGVGQWTHLVLTIDNANAVARFYANGVLKSTATWDKTTQNATDASGDYIGYLNSLAEFNGTLDEARIYKRALTSDEVIKLYNYAPPPVAYYTFDEGSGTTLNDSSGNGNNSTAFNGSPAWVQGKYGGGMYFNGSSYVRVNQPILTASDSSIMFWLKIPVQSASFYRVLSDSTNGIDLYFTGTGTNGLYGTIGDSVAGWTVTSPNLADNNWHYISLVSTSSDGNTRAYVDGKLQSTTNKTYSTITLDDLYIGSNAGGSNYKMTGTLDDLKIYNYARTPSQITQDLNGGHPLGGSPIASQVGYYKFDEGYGTTLHNTGNGGSVLDGTISGATWSNDGKFGKALQFDGASSNVTINDNASLDLSSEWTISGWFNPAETVLTGSDRQVLISKWQTSSGLLINYYLYIRTNGKVEAAVANGSTSKVATGTTTLSPNKWYYLAATFNGTTGDLKLYVNGVLEATTATGYTTAYTNTGNVKLGQYDFAWSSYRDEFKGLMDEVKIYSAALSSSEIKIDYNNGSALILGATSNTSGLTGGTIASNSASAAYCIPGDTASCSSPIAEWSFNEGRGTTINDTSGNGNTGTLTGSPTWVQGEIGSGLLFDTSGSDSMTTPGVAVGSTWTVTTWSKFPLTVTGTYRTLVRETSSVHHILVDSSGLLGVYNGSFASSGFDVDTLSTGWHNLAAVGSGGTTMFYVDGKYVGTSAQQVTTAIKQIGQAGALQQWGAIDNMVIYNYARTPAQIAWDYNQGKPVASYDFDECSGSTLHDLMFGINGTITIGGTGTQTSVGTCATSSTAWGNGATGKFNNSLNFDGTDDYVNMGQPSALQFTGSFSLSAWINNTENNQGGIISKWYNTNGNRSYRLISNNGSFDFYVSSDGTAISSCTSSAGLNTGSWQHILAVYDATAGTATLYKNGSLLKTCSGFPTAIFNNAQNFNIGTSDAGTTGSNTYTGQIDDVKVFSYPLTKQQVQNLYNQGGAVRFGP